MRLSCSFLLAVCFSIADTASSEAQTVRYAQDFDLVTAPTLPPGWSSPADAWTTSTSVASPGSGGNNIENRGNNPGLVLTPTFDFSAVTSATLRYDIRRTATYDSLNIQLEASTDGGETWGVVILDSTASLPAPPSTYITVEAAIPPEITGQSQVQLRFRAMHQTGGNVRIDDVEIEADGPLAYNRFGFSSAGSTIVDGSSVLTVAVGIEMISTSDGLQGLQFVISHTGGVSILSLDRGIPALNNPEWHLTHEADGPSLRVVLLAEGTDGLPPVATDSLLLVNLAVAPLGGESSRTDSLRISHVVASSPSDSGLDLSLALDQPVYVLTVQAEAPALSVDSTAVDFGTIELGASAQSVLTLSNTGSGVLDVTDMFSISGLLGIEPAFLTIESGASANVTLTADGDSYGLGSFEDWLIIDYNGPESPDTLAITGNVVDSHVRGDANDDGVVDVVDLVLGIDLILGRADLPETASRLDLHPFPDGNEGVDVRDLTVLAQAIARGLWPDGMALPESTELVAKDASIVGDLIIRRDDGSTSIWIRSAEPLRAVHLVGRLSDSEAVIVVDESLPTTHVGRPYRGANKETFSLLTYGMDVLPGRAGQPVLLATIDSPTVIDFDPVSAMAVDRSLNRRSLVTVRESDEHPPDSPGLRIEHPYPNPINPLHSALVHLPVTLTERARVRVVARDVLGRDIRALEFVLDSGTRVVAWDMRNEGGLIVPPGLYLLTAEFDGSRQTRTVVVN